MTARRAVLVVATVFAVLAAGVCAADEGNDIGSPIFDGTTPDGLIVDPPITTLPPPDIDAIRVPFDFFSVQDAVDAAQPGDLVLLDPGVYTEEITIRTPDIVLRGRDRNSVFIDGLHEAATGITVIADGVAVENMTVRNYTVDAIAVDATGAPAPIDGFRALHITTSNTAGNGIVVRNGVNVEVREVWASGHGAAGIAIEDCLDCRTTVETTLVEFSARGISIVGASGAVGSGVTVVRSTARNNRVGIVVEDQNGAPSAGTVVAGSVVLNNGFSTTPRLVEGWDHAFGVGIHVAGGSETLIDRNRIAGNTRVGVLLAPSADRASGDPTGVTIAGNEITGHPEGDVSFAYESGAVDPGLCLTGNTLDTITPPGADAAARCSEENAAPPVRGWTAASAPTIPYQNGPVPPGIEGLPDADAALPIPAGPVAMVDLVAVVVPVA